MPTCSASRAWPDNSPSCLKLGVDTVKEFRHRVPENLHKRLEEINAERNLCGRIPTLHELEKMIAQAKELAPAVSY